MKVRYAKKNEKEIAKKHWENSFNDSEKQIDFYFNNIFNYKNYLVLEKEKRIISSLHENPYILNFNLNEIKTKYIVGVSTVISEQRKGYMTHLLKEMLKNSKKENYPFVFLSPINPDIYRRYGFEYFSKIENYSFDIENLADLKFDTELDFKEIEKDNKKHYIKDLQKIYEFNMLKKFCFLKRDDYYFNKLLDECFNDDMKIFISYKFNEPLSYIIFANYNNKIEVRECFALDYESLESTCALLYAYRDYYSKVSIDTYDGSNLDFLFKNQLKIEKKDFPFMMLRILDPLKILEYCNIKNNNLKIYIEDEIFSENTGIYHFNKKWKFSKEKDDYLFKIKIKDLTLLLSGFFDLEDLINMKKIQFKTYENIEIDKLEKIFYKKKSYLYEFQ